MRTYSTREAAQKLGINRVTLQRYIAKGLITVPSVKSLGGGQFREWAERDIERVRKQLPKIKNGRRKKTAR
jgi:DNA-binding transcriptional MerR regulator